MASRQIDYVFQWHRLCINQVLRLASSRILFIHSFTHLLFKIHPRVSNALSLMSFYLSIQPRRAMCPLSSAASFSLMYTYIFFIFYIPSQKKKQKKKRFRYAPTDILKGTKLLKDFIHCLIELAVNWWREYIHVFFWNNKYSHFQLNKKKKIIKNIYTHGYVLSMAFHTPWSFTQENL